MNEGKLLRALRLLFQRQSFPSPILANIKIVCFSLLLWFLHEFEGRFIFEFHSDFKLSSLILCHTELFVMIVKNIPLNKLLPVSSREYCFLSFGVFSFSGSQSVLYKIPFGAQPPSTHSYIHYLFSNCIIFYLNIFELN